MADNTTIPVSVSNIKALKSEIDAAYIASGSVTAAASTATLKLLDTEGNTKATVTLPASTTSAAGLMTSTQATKLDSLSNYTLPTASSSTLGGVKIGSGIAVASDGTISYTLPTASASALGGVKIGSGINLATDGTISVTLPSNPIVFKGTVSAVGNLPSSGNSSGDMYLVGSASPYSEYFWTGSAWELFGSFDSTVDMSTYVAKSDFLSDSDFLTAISA